MRRVAVYCGSNAGGRAAYRAAAEAFARAAVGRGLGIVYGGGNVGMMGALADAALAAGGEVVGVIPRVLVDKELAHDRLTALHVVDTMHERKARMAELADAFVALPGGLGTLDELFEALTWAQLGLHAKPCGLLDVADYYARLVAFLDHAAAERFVAPAHRAMLLVERTPDALLDALADYRAPVVPKWLDREDL